jgi:hypothetical protein
MSLYWIDHDWPSYPDEVLDLASTTKALRLHVEQYRVDEERIRRCSHEMGEWLDSSIVNFSFRSCKHCSFGEYKSKAF